MEIFKKLEESSNLYPYFDYAHGYGVPQASYFYPKINEEIPTFSIIQNDSIIKILIKDDYFQFAEVIQRKSIISDLLDEIIHLNDGYSTAYASIKKDLHPYFYFHVENNEGYLDSYKVLSVIQKDILTLNTDEFKNKTLRFHYRGYTLMVEL